MKGTNSESWPWVKGENPQAESHLSSLTQETKRSPGLGWRAGRLPDGGGARTTTEREGGGRWLALQISYVMPLFWGVAYLRDSCYRRSLKDERRSDGVGNTSCDLKGQ